MNQLQHLTHRLGGTLTERLLSENAKRFFLLIVTSLVISLLMTSVALNLDTPVSYSQGEIAKQTIRAPHDVVVEDALTTEKRRLSATKSVKSVFSFVSSRNTEPTNHLNYFLSAIRDISGGISDSHGQLLVPQQKRVDLELRLKLNLVGEEWDVILNPSLWPELENAIIRITQPIITRGIISSKQPIRESLNNTGAILHDRESGKENELRSEADIFDMNEATSKANMSYPVGGFGKGAAFDSVVKKLVSLTLQPNIVFDAEETSRRIQNAREEVDASVLKIQRGQVLVRAGDPVSSSQELLLKQFVGTEPSTSAFRIFFGYSMLSAVLICCFYFFGANTWSTFKPKPRDLLLMSLTLCGSFALLRLFSVLAEALSYSFTYLDSGTFLLVSPIAAGGIVLQVILGSSTAFLWTMTFAILTGVFLDDSWLLLALICCGTLQGALTVKRCSRRSLFIYAGLRVAAINTLVIVCFLLLFPEMNSGEASAKLLCAVLGGLFSGVLAGGITPIAEYVGGYISDIKLLELASLDHPLLRELSLQAPGTWNHSMVMGQIGEAAAEAIGANPLLTRVGAFYHDIGKARKPAYFVENQSGRENRHDKLAPSMSALIIKAHVKDGIEMAEEHRLPKVLVDFIPQHHGNSLIEYFYDKALKEKEEDEIVDESHYRYPGPRPQTKEAGILMLADSVEASSRTLSDPTPAKIQGLVQKMINKIFVSGELNECNLTLKDLHSIAKSFTRVLTGIYHRRIEYNEPAEKVREGKTSKGKANEPKTADSKLPAEKLEVEIEQDVEGKKDYYRASQENEVNRRNHETLSKKSGPTDHKEALKRLGMQ